MSGTVSLSDLIIKIRRRSNMERSKLVTDSEITDYINTSIADLYDLIIDCRGEQYFESSVDITMINGSELYDLPLDFYKVESVLTDSGYPINTFDRRDAHHKAKNLSYSIRGNKFAVNRSDSNQKLKMFYIPLAPTLVAPEDTTDFYNGWERYVVCDCSIICLNKEESDTAQLERELDRMQRRIKSSSDKNTHQPSRVVDVEGRFHEDREIY
jgi:hypothetical protein